MMEVDTGAAVSLISAEDKTNLFPSCSLSPTTLTLSTYTGEAIPVLGQMVVEVSYNHFTGHLHLYVVGGKGPALMGRDWLRQIRLDWLAIHKATACTATTKGVQEQRVEALLKYAPVFQEGLGEMNTFTATVSVREGAKPKFWKPRPVPFALREAVKRELDRLEKAGIIEKVKYSQWAAPVVPVPKGDGQLRLCGDYKVTNPALETEQYPLPKLNDIFATLAGGKVFSKIDLTHAYQQMRLDPESRELVTINTHKGLYHYTRLPFGVASAPALFQRVMDTVMQGLPRVACYLGNILITGETPEEHMATLEVLKCLQAYGIRAKQSKCAFLSLAVEYLGHRIDTTGLHTLSSKVEAVTQAPEPKDIGELRSFLGLLHYYGKFLPSLASVLHPLNDLLKEDTAWSWSTECAKVFAEAKQLLVKAPVLAHFDQPYPSVQGMLLPTVLGP